MYSLLPSFILGFHGCDRETAEAILSGHARLNPSTNNYDWLGSGVYFWENSPARALAHAQRESRRRQSKVRHPFVLGAVIDLGCCLNLLDSEYLRIVRDGYVSLKAMIANSGTPMPQNKKLAGGKDLLLRELDCAVIQMVHTIREREALRPFDSVRGVFIEGEDLYPNAGFRDKNHIQVCVRNLDCIKGYFRPLPPTHTGRTVPRQPPDQL